MAKKSQQPTKKDVFNNIISRLQKDGWANLNLSTVAREAKIPLDVMYAYFPTKMHALEYLMQEIDQACLASIASESSDENPRDRLFSILMARFDAMEPYKGLLSSLQADVWKEPWNFLCLMPPLMTSLTWMLNAVRFDTTGLAGSVRVKIFLVIYFTLLPTWLSDESADLSATMAALDRALERLAQVPLFYPV
jgi:AcrR family transcriptional regulator